MRRLSLAISVGMLGALMIWAFMPSPWSTEMTELCPTPSDDIAKGCQPGNTVSESLFESYGIAVLLMSLILSACMLGAVYIAKMEEMP